VVPFLGSIDTYGSMNFSGERYTCPTGDGTSRSRLSSFDCMWLLYAFGRISDIIAQRL
jgi:hypothetical protein